GLETSLNDNPYNIKLTNGYLTTDVYRKSTAVNSLFHASSAHHPQTTRVILVGQFFSMRRICSESKFQNQAGVLTRQLQQRGYNHKDIRKGYRRAAGTQRGQLLTKRKVSHLQDEPIRLITTFNSRWTDVMAILRRHWSILTADEDLSRYLPANPSVTWRRSKNLKDLLTRSHYVAPQKSYFSTRAGPVWGSFQCCDCSACQYMDRAFTFDNSGMTRAYKITHHISCTTDMVIHYAYCPCKLIYVRMTTRQLRLRILEHARDIKNAAMAHDLSILKTIPKHFRIHHNSNPKTLRVKGIDRVQLGICGGDYRKEFLKRETKWMVCLDTVAPKGLNEALSFKSFL
ncbi:unnamed protein product, partial [Ranitomeya imitator]